MAMEMMPEDEFLRSISAEEGPLAYYKKNRLAGIYRRVGHRMCFALKDHLSFPETSHGRHAWLSMTRIVHVQDPKQELTIVALQRLYDELAAALRPRRPSGLTVVEHVGRTKKRDSWYMAASEHSITMASLQCCMFRHQYNNYNGQNNCRSFEKNQCSLRLLASHT